MGENKNTHVFILINQGSRRVYGWWKQLDFDASVNIPCFAAYKQACSRCDSVTLEEKQHSVVFLYSRAVSLRAQQQECSIPLAVSCQTSRLKYVYIESGTVMTTLSRVAIPDSQTKFASWSSLCFHQTKKDNLAASLLTTGF